MQTILYIDHIQSHRFLFQEELSEEGYRVVTAKNIEEVLSTKRDFAPDLITLELRQPTLQKEKIENLRKCFPGTPCIGYSTFDQCLDEYRKWVDGYLPKWSSMEEVKKLIRDTTVKQ